MKQSERIRAIVNVAMICETKFSKKLEPGQLPQDIITNRNDLICKITYVAFGKRKNIDKFINIYI